MFKVEEKWKNNSEKSNFKIVSVVHENLFSFGIITKRCY